MKKILSLVLVAFMLFACFALTSCNDDQVSVKTEHTYVAAYSKTVTMGETEITMEGRVLINLTNDGKAEIYVGLNSMGGYSTAKYDGTWSMATNEEFDDVLTVEYNYSETESAKIDAVTVIDSTFEAPMYMVASMSSDDLTFYELDPVTMGNGDGYVGVLKKTTGGMGDMLYTYYLEMNEDGTFTTSIFQRAVVMNIKGTQSGTYTKDGENISFTYDVSDGEGGIATEDFVSTGTVVSENLISVGFNIGQTSMASSNANFYKVK